MHASRWPLWHHVVHHIAHRCMAAIVLACVMIPPVVFAQTARVPTTVTSIGLFYQPGAPERIDLRADGVDGQALNLQGRVLDTSGRPVSNALVELWHADAIGSVDESRFRTAQTTDAKGLFRIKTTLPGHIPMARDNAVFAGRHIHVVVSHPDHQQLVSLIFFKGDAALADNPYPELAIALEESQSDSGPILFGRVELIIVPH